MHLGKDLSTDNARYLHALGIWDIDRWYVQGQGEGKMRFVAVIQIGRIHYWSTQDDFYLNVYNYIV